MYKLNAIRLTTDRKLHIVKKEDLDDFFKRYDKSKVKSITQAGDSFLKYFT